MENYPKDFDIPVPWGVVCAKWWGPESKEPILFLHGWQDNMGSFDNLIPLLPKGLPYVSIDFPGHGLSSPYPKGSFYYLFWDCLVLIRRIVKQMGWEKISIIGHSMGGAAGFLYAGAYPDQIERLVCLDIAGPRVCNPSEIVKSTSDSIERFLEYESLKETDQPCHEYNEMLAIAISGYKGSIDRHSANILLKRGVKPSESSSDKLVFSRDVRLKASFLALPTLDVVLEFASKIRCHYLNLGAASGIQRDYSKLYHKLLDIIKTGAKSFEYVELPGTHHFHLNNPETLSPYISDFLRSHPLANGLV